MNSKVVILIGFFLLNGSVSTVSASSSSAAANRRTKPTTTTSFLPHRRYDNGIELKNRVEYSHLQKYYEEAPQPTQQQQQEKVYEEKKYFCCERISRGGSNAVVDIQPDEDLDLKSTKIENDEKLKNMEEMESYCWQQQLLLSSRSLQLRQALISRGISELQHTTTDSSDSSTTTVLKQIIDWECALSTKKSPKSCLYSFDAEIGTKVIAPTILPTTTKSTTTTSDTTTSTSSSSAPTKNYQWITIQSLNRLRRMDESKIEPLWHNQYHILSTWFHPFHPYSLYQHMNWFDRTIISNMFLDEPVILQLVLITMIFTFAFVSFPVWEYVICQICLPHPFVWNTWVHWSRFIHSALPLRLLLVQMLLKGIQYLFYDILYQTVRNVLIDYECTILERCTPLTIIE